MEPAVNTALKFELITCYDCGVPFYVPQNWIELRRRDHKTFTCPNGHEQHFLSGKEDLQVLLGKLKKLNAGDIALVEELGPLLALIKIIYEPNAVCPQELEKLLAILVKFQEKESEKEKKQ